MLSFKSFRWIQSIQQCRHKIQNQPQNPIPNFINTFIFKNKIVQISKNWQEK